MAPGMKVCGCRARIFLSKKLEKEQRRAAAIDSKFVETTELGGKERGNEGAKRFPAVLSDLNRTIPHNSRSLNGRSILLANASGLKANAF
jgi:hypothetical protein